MSERSAREEIDRGLVFVKRSFTYWKRALLVFVIGVAIAFPYTLTRPRSYRSETIILYQETIKSSDIGGGDSETSARRIAPRLKEMLLSRTTLEPIIKELGLYMKGKDPNDRRALIDAVDEMRKHISFKAREGDTFEIAFDSSTPELTLEVTKRLGQCILDEALNRRKDQNKALVEFLTAQSDRNSQDLHLREANLARFVAAHPILAARLMGQIQPGAPGTVAPAPGVVVNTGDPILNGLETRAARIDRQLAKANSAVPPPPPKPPAPFVPPPESAELVAARKDMADKAAHYTERHPDVTAAKARLKQAEDAHAATVAAAAEAHAAQQAAQRAAQVDEPAPKNEADVAALKKELSDIHTQIGLRRAQIAGTKGDAAVPAPGPVPGELPGSEVTLEVEFRSVQRAVNEARDAQTAIDAKLFKARLNLDVGNDARNVTATVLDPAYLPSRPVSSSRTNLLAGLLGVSFMLALGIMLVSAKLDDRIHDQVDLERLDILPVIGVIPRAELPAPPSARGGGANDPTGPPKR